MMLLLQNALFWNAANLILVIEQNANLGCKMLLFCQDFPHYYNLRKEIYIKIIGK